MNQTHYILQFRDTTKPDGNVVNVYPPKPIHLLKESIKMTAAPLKNVCVFKIKMKNE